MAKTASKPVESLAVSMDQDEFVAGGLATDFDGLVTEARAVIWNYDNGNGPMVDDEGHVVYTLAVRATIKRTDDEEDVITYWSAGDPAQFVPSNDGATPSPVGEDGCAEGTMFIRTGAKMQLNNNTNWAQFLQALKDAESQTPQLARKRTPSVEFLEGLFGHWDRIPQKKRSGMVSREEAPGKKSTTREILACTAIKPAPAGTTATTATTAKAAPAAKATTSAAPAAPAGADDFTSKLRDIVKAAVDAAGDEGLLKGKLANAVLKATTLAQPEKAKGVPTVTKNEFLEAGMVDELWVFDADSGTLTPWPTE